MAGERFAAVGFHSLSMDAIAEAAGVSKPVLYQHFPSKRALYLALVDDAAFEMQARVTQALEGTTDNRQRVRGAIEAFFGFVEDDRFRLLFLTADATDAEVAGIVDTARQGVAASVAKLIAADAGLSTAGADLLATGIRGLAVEGAQWWVEHPEVDRDAAVQLLGRFMWRGLAGFERSEG